MQGIELPSPAGGIALGTNQGEEHLLGAVIGAACSDAEGWVKTGTHVISRAPLKQLPFSLEPGDGFHLKGRISYQH